MKLLILSSFFFLLVSSTIYAQKIVYSAGFGIGSMMEYDDQNTKIIESKSYRFLQDSMYEVAVVERETTTSSTYQSMMYFSVYGTMDFRLTKKLELSTGLSFSYGHIEEKKRYASKVLNQKVVDTVMQNPLNQPLQFEIGCDSSVFLPTGINTGPDYRLLNLQIPLSLKYEIFDGFKINVGAQLITPIFSRQKGLTLKTDKTVENDKTICVTTTHSFNDYSGKGLRDLRLAILSGASYKVTPKLEVNVLIEKSLQDLFYTKNQRFINQGVYKPIGLQLGVKYYFGESKAPAEN